MKKSFIVVIGLAMWTLTMSLFEGALLMQNNLLNLGYWLRMVANVIAIGGCLWVVYIVTINKDINIMLKRGNKKKGKK